MLEFEYGSGVARQMNSIEISEVASSYNSSTATLMPGLASIGPKMGVCLEPVNRFMPADVIEIVGANSVGLALTLLVHLIVGTLNIEVKMFIGLATYSGR
jgi:hypothetical protein